MERVETILRQLQEQFRNGAGADQLLLTAQKLQHELLHIQVNEPVASKGAVIVTMPLNNLPPKSPRPVELDKLPAPEDKTVEVLQVDEAELVAELEQIKQSAAIRQQRISQSKPHLLFDSEEDDIPTLNHQGKNRSKEINETVAGGAASINERLKEKKVEISEKLTGLPVKDLKKAIGINDRFLYINDLFRGDEAMYERSIKTINGFSIWPEAEYWIRRELKTKLGWTDDNETVKQFDQLVKRRFS
jgi:hypothetical protein